MIPAHRYFVLLKSSEHDVILTSFTADLSRIGKIPSVGACEIDQRWSMQSLLAIYAFILSYRKISGGGRLAPPHNGARINPILGEP